MMQNKYISSDNVLYHHLIYFADEHEREKVDYLEKKLDDGIVDTGIADQYDTDFFKTYFDSNSDD